jgi:hypothetical protein
MGTTNSKLPGPIIMIDRSEILSRSQVQIISFFFQGTHTTVLRAFYQPQQGARIWRWKTNFLVKPAHFDIFAIIFIVSSCILCTGGDALMCDKVLVHKLILSLTHSLTHDFGIDFVLLASGEMFLFLLVTCWKPWHQSQKRMSKLEII